MVKKYNVVLSMKSSFIEKENLRIIANMDISKQKWKKDPKCSKQLVGETIISGS